MPAEEQEVAAAESDAAKTGALHGGSHPSTVTRRDHVVLHTDGHVGGPQPATLARIVTGQGQIGVSAAQGADALGQFWTHPKETPSLKGRECRDTLHREKRRHKGDFVSGPRSWSTKGR